MNFRFFYKRKAKRIPTKAAEQEAMQNPGGWVYEIEGDYSAEEDIPPEAIVGAWKVDDHGQRVYFNRATHMPNNTLFTGCRPDVQFQHKGQTYIIEVQSRKQSYDFLRIDKGAKYNTAFGIRGFSNRYFVIRHPDQGGASDILSDPTTIQLLNNL